jgi:hypothetical protein
MHVTGADDLRDPTRNPVSYGHMDPREAIAANVRLTIETLGPMSGLDFGLDRPSVEWLEGFIERQRVQSRGDGQEAFVGRMVSILASFLGECIAVGSGGTWIWLEDYHTWVVRLADNMDVFPFSKVQKAFDSGLDGGESVLSFYDTAMDHEKIFPPSGRSDCGAAT